MSLSNLLCRPTRFLHQVPIAIAVSDLGSDERVVYANPEFEKLSGVTAAKLTRENWAVLSGSAISQPADKALVQALVEQTDFVGTFRLDRGEDKPAIVDVYSNLIQEDNGKVCFRLVALVDVSATARLTAARSRSASAKKTFSCANSSTGSRTICR